MKITRRPPPTDFGASNDDGRPAADQEADAHSPEPSSTQGPSTESPAQQAQADAARSEPDPPLSLAARAQAVAPRQAAPSAPSASEDPKGWPIYLLAFAVAVLWALGPLAFAVGYRNAVAPLQNDRFGLVVFGLLAVGPAALVFAVAYCVRQAQKLAAERRRAQATEAALLAPALRAAARAGDVARAVREEIASAAAAADLARDSLEALRRALAGEAEGLVQATHASLSAAQQLSGELGRERGELEALTRGLDSQAARAAEVIGQQARKVAEVSQGAEAQLREAERVLEARTAGIAAAAGEASQATRIAGEDLARHVARLESAGAGVVDQVRAVEGGLSEQRTALVGLAQALRGDHEVFAAQAEAHAERLDDFIGQARRAAGEMSARAADAGDTLRILIGEAAERFAELAASVRVEREAFGETAGRAFDDIARAAGDQRTRLETETREAIDALGRAAEETRRAAARHAAAAREQIDQLSEAAFVAGQKANQVFEARLEEARALVEQSAKMVGEAGAVAAGKLDEGAASARAALDELCGMMQALEARARDLPPHALAQAQAVQAAVAQGMDALMGHARRTAEEAQAIDAAFQERVRRNFDMLSEAVRLMGTVAAAPPGALAPLTPLRAPDPAPTPPALGAPSGFAQPYAPPVVRAAASEAVAKPAAAHRPELLAPAPVEPAPVEPAPVAPASAPAPGEPALQPGAALAERLGLRPRLKLAPTSADAAFSAVFESAPAPHALAEEADEEQPAETWTWKDLLASLGGGEEEEGRPPAEEVALAAELGQMGVEPEKLLPAARTEQIAAALQSGDLDGARQVVKRLAGASSRRIVRRLFTDAGLKARAGDFVRRYQGLVDDAAARDPEGVVMANLLGCEAGRVFLLLDQALGDAA